MVRRHYEPREYQGPGTAHIIDNPMCALWAGMGLGKCVMTYTALDALFLCGDAYPALVLGPLRVARDTWAKEARKWEHLRNISVMPIVGSEDERRMALKYDASVYTTNYENLPWLVEHYGPRWPFRTIVPDEATRLKGFRVKQGTARSKALARAILEHKRTERVIELTGTPSPNGLADLWGQMWFLDQGRRLGVTYEAFKQRWFQRSHTGYGVDPLPFAMEQIQDKCRDLCMTIDAADYFDLEEPIVNNIIVDLPPKARNRYREMEDDMFTILEEKEIEVFNAAARTQKLLQFANGAAYLNPEVDCDGHPRAKEWRVVHNEKLEALRSCIEEAGGMPMIVSYEFKSDAARILKEFGDRAVNLATSSGFDQFMRGKTPVGLAHPQSMGHGIDGLQDVSNIITYFGHNWDLEKRMQIYERIGPVRQLQSGFKRPVFVNNIIARDTVDEDVIARVDTKRGVQDTLLEAMKRRGAHGG